jgi:hypothetical protein
MSSNTRLTESLFGDWAALVDNDAASLAAALRSVKDDRLDLETYRSQWNEGVLDGIGELHAFLAATIAATRV